MILGTSIGLTQSAVQVPTVGLDLDAAIAALFSSGEEGAWYDPSDLTTLYQDSLGTTPVTGTGQPVGLMLDKSKGGLQAEEITNGGFDIATGWTAVNGTLTISGGTATLAGINQNDPYFVSPAFPVTGGSWYRISIDIISSGGSPTNVNYIRLRSPGSFTGAVGIISNTALPVGTKTAIVQIPAGWTQAELAVQRGGALIPPTTTLVVDNASVRELPGNHATQATSTARPTLQLSGSSYYLDFDGVDDLMRSSSFPAIAQPISAALGFRASAIPKFIIDGHDANEFSLITINVSGVDKLRFVSGDSSPYLLVDYTYGGDTVARVLANGASSVIAIDGAETVGAVSATAAVTAWTLGGSGVDTFELDGRIYGFVAIDRTLDPDEITSVESYLADKTGAFTAPVITGSPTISVS